MVVKVLDKTTERVGRCGIALTEEAVQDRASAETCFKLVEQRGGRRHRNARVMAESRQQPVVYGAQNDNGVGIVGLPENVVEFQKADRNESVEVSKPTDQTAGARPESLGALGGSAVLPNCI